MDAFNVDDKVFATVKGYPAWPAIVIDKLRNKYVVRFFGTGKYGEVSPSNVFDYLQHKNTLKSLKRSDYCEAMEEIENAVNECGGSDEVYEVVDTSISSDTNVNDNSDSNKTTKRKRSVSSDELNDSYEKKRSTTTPTITESDPNSVQDAELTEKNIVTINQNENSLMDTVDQSARIENILSLSPTDVNIVSDAYLRALIAYAEHINKNEEIYKNKHVETRNQIGNEVLMAKLPSRKYIGIKYNRDHPPSVENEYERAEYDASEAKRILSLKNLLQEGKCNPEENPNLFETNLNIDESHIQQILKSGLTERTLTKLKFLRIEDRMFHLDLNIKESLGMNKACPKTAVESLNLMLQLEISPLMLKKQPHVVDMVRRVHMYIGNTRKWKLAEDMLKKFAVDAKELRDKAAEVYTKFSQLFNMSNESMFWDFFTKEVEEFKQQVKDMQENQMLALTAEPNSRQAFLDSFDDEEVQKIVAAKMEKGNMKKNLQENLSKAASSESNTEENPTSSTS